MTLMKLEKGCLFGALLLAATAMELAGQTPVRAGATQAAKPRLNFPDAPGKDTVQKVCGVCHGAEVVVPRGMGRQEWGQVIASMVTRGAKGTDEEFATVLDYLANNFPAEKAAAAGRASGPAVATDATPRRVGRNTGVGSDDKHVVDPAAADRGKTIYIAECITCHGQKARGKEDNPDLVRSVTVLHDRYGSVIGPFLRKGHPMQSGRASAKLTQTQVEDLSDFLHQRVDDTLRSGPYSKVLNVLTGDAKAGSAYFNGEGRCNTCHSPMGDLAGVAKKYDPPTLQQRFLFPQSIGFGRGGRGMARSKPVKVTVTRGSEPSVSGVLVNMDDFDIALRDSAGEYHSWKRTPAVKIDIQDPYAGHIELLERYSDKNIHDVVAYLETLQ
jgi:cytochrome c oxidase cbb3-type subunit 3